MAEANPTGAQFAAAFEEAFEQLRGRIEDACAGSNEWPVRIALGVRAAFDFAAENPDAGCLLTRDALTYAGVEGDTHFQRLVAYLADLLRATHALASRRHGPPAIAVDATAGGLALLVGQRLFDGQGDELQAMVGETIQLVLMPYLGIEKARRIAAEYG